MGNDVLKAFTLIINDNIRSEDILGRYGGDEFLIVFPESNAQQAKVVLERIKENLLQAKINSAYISEGEEIQVMFSAGIASFSQQARDMNKLISAADNALYRAKNAGRNRIFIENKDN